MTSRRTRKNGGRVVLSQIKAKRRGSDTVAQQVNWKALENELHAEFKSRKSERRAS